MGLSRSVVKVGEEEEHANGRYQTYWHWKASQSRAPSRLGSVRGIIELGYMEILGVVYRPLVQYTTQTILGFNTGRDFSPLHAYHPSILVLYRRAFI
jgi:hypothetical protein